MLHEFKQALPEGVFTDFLGRIGNGFFCRLAAAVEVLERLDQDGCVEAISLAQRDEMLGLELFEREIGSAADRQRKDAVFRVEGGGDQVVGRGKPQTVRRMEHGKVF